MELSQYQVVLVNLDPTIGSEVKKTRPCVILSPDEMNKFLRTVIIAPITGTSKKYPTRIEIKGKTTKGWIMIDQIRTVDRRRITRIFGSLSENEVLEVKKVIQEAFID
ncbi:type II toxin-antitoxin system PemK/MazF family toxin [Haoranjiania flava]|uniref:mRNA interferase n=1 Tax=Haoranjiania flava TaxID=1856322 RepID=A0AAE3LQX1_9BACT|nr:type II toxin-antitoxin system PemK/MazF family toxin [Haoranjiania flava]MCU7694890.1 type II toxin-antitoxin system PemK/MazF family toxin [Haoranjiania flava]